MPIAFDNTYARLPDGFFARIDPDPAPDPQLVRLNRSLATEIGLDPDWLESPEGVAMLSGAGVAEGSEPIAMAYAGHQFGGWSHQLGDGRAHLLGEVVGPDGIRRDIQLKGSGRTPFSRNGDGKAALGPVLREYIVSEFMAAAGVPTTRALAAVLTGERVQRETGLPGAVLARVAQSHVRVGTFQYFHAREQTDKVRALADYVIDRHYPAAREAENPVLAMLDEVVARQADLIAHWMALGFIHGVMNTDNMQIAGETIDYGPCAFMDVFHPATVFSSIDRGGRYAWANQPNIGVWNLSRLAEALLVLIDDDPDKAVEKAQQSVGAFGVRFNSALEDRFADKLGMARDADFMQETFKVMTDQGVDFTLFFRSLTRVAEGEEDADLLSFFLDASAGQTWQAEWHARHDPARLEAMKAANPVYIPRNHRVEQALTAANDGDFTKFETLLDVLKDPFTARAEHASFEAPPSPDEVVHQTFCGT